MKFGEYVQTLNEVVNVTENGPDVHEIVREHKVLNSELVINVEMGHRWDTERNILVSIINSIFNYDKGRSVVVRHSALGETIDAKAFKTAIKDLRAELTKYQIDYMADIEKILTKHGFEFVLSKATVKSKPDAKPETKTVADDDLGDIEDIEDLDEE